MEEDLDADGKIPTEGGVEDCNFGPFAPPSAHWLATAGFDVQLLPYWNGSQEQPEHRAAILEFHVKLCQDYQNGCCTKHAGKGKVPLCFDYHFESQIRRCPVDCTTGQLLYWDAPCQAWGSEMAFCPNGDGCLFAHGFEEVSYHPAKYKTKLCNGRDCRGEDLCCFAHGEGELRDWAPDYYAYLSIVGPVLGFGTAGMGSGNVVGGQNAARRGTPGASGAPGPLLKHRFCAYYPNVVQCRRGAACAFAHTRDEVKTPLLSIDEEEHKPTSLTEPFFTMKFKTLWCPIGAQHDWQSCVYAHTYQDARRKPSIGYGPQPCPYWSKKDTRAAYSQRCPLGLRCPYSHGAKEQLYHPKYFRTVICRDLQQKCCPRQNLCAFHHKRAERRSVGADNVDYTKPLKKQAIPADWAAIFLAPPFFQETGEADQQVPMNFAQPAPGAWAQQMGVVPMAAMQGGGKANNWSPYMGGAASSAVGLEVGEASRTAETMPASSPRTQSTATEDIDSAPANGAVSSARAWLDAGSSENVYFHPECYGGDGGDGSSYGSFPVFAGNGAMMQPMWWSNGATDDNEAMPN